jgi:serine/threonine protein kinase
MSFPPGTSIGPYEIRGALGSGGMGDVYLAHDSRLGRDVAIKVLPSAYATDQDRLRRFEQEARAASALNHPAIVTVHDIGSANAFPFLCMELVKGQTLRQLIAEGPLRSAACCRSPPRSPMASRRPMKPASSIATSSRRT